MLAPERRKPSSDPHRWRFSEPGCAARSPGFLFARGFPVDAWVCADPNAPLAESAYARASEARSSGFESRVGYQIRSRRRCAFAALLQLGCGKDAPSRRSEPASGSRAARRGGGFESAFSTNFISLWRSRQARVVRDHEAAGSSPAGEPSHAPVAQRTSATLRTSRTGVRVSPGAPNEAP